MEQNKDAGDPRQKNLADTYNHTLRTFNEHNVLRDICGMNSDIEHLRYLKTNRIRFTLVTWNYFQTKRCWYEIVHFTSAITSSGKLANIRVFVKSVTVNDSITMNTHWVVSQYLYLDFGKLLKSGITLILDESLHEGLRIAHERKKAA